MSVAPLNLTAELSAVPADALREFLAAFSRSLVSRLSADITEDRWEKAFGVTFASITGVGAALLDVKLEFRHNCRHTGCGFEDCQLCRNNPNKVCDDAAMLDQQYWVRDDSKAGQPVRARCGADVALQVTSRSSGEALHIPGVRIKLYVIDGAPTSTPSLTEPVPALVCSDDGRPLFTAAGVSPETDGGLLLETILDERLGPVAPFPELQFLDKNSKFKARRRGFRSFKLLACAVRSSTSAGPEVVLAQVESEPFKVTTKKGYDGCRKAEYLHAKEIITDKTFASLGETTINNLKSVFEGVESVEDLQRLVEQSYADTALQLRLRDVLNMSRDMDKWRNLCRMLAEKVVQDDNVMRLWMLPASPNLNTRGAPIGLLYRAQRAQVDFGSPMGIVVSHPLPGKPLKVGVVSESLQVQAGRQLEHLRWLARAHFGVARHPGWRLEAVDVEWREVTVQAFLQAFKDALGSTDAGPNAIAAALAAVRAGGGHAGGSAPMSVSTSTACAAPNGAHLGAGVPRPASGAGDSEGNYAQSGERLETASPAVGGSLGELSSAMLASAGGGASGGGAVAGAGAGGWRHPPPKSVTPPLLPLGGLAATPLLPQPGVQLVRSGSSTWGSQRQEQQTPAARCMPQRNISMPQARTLQTLLAPEISDLPSHGSLPVPLQPPSHPVQPAQLPTSAPPAHVSPQLQALAAQQLQAQLQAQQPQLRAQQLLAQRLQAQQLQALQAHGAAQMSVSHLLGAQVQQLQALHAQGAAHLQAQQLHAMQAQQAQATQVQQAQALQALHAQAAAQLQGVHLQASQVQQLQLQRMQPPHPLLSPMLQPQAGLGPRGVAPTHQPPALPGELPAPHDTPAAGVGGVSGAGAEQLMQLRPGEKAALLQQAFKEGWPMSEVQTLLGSMSDGELRALLSGNLNLTEGGAGAGLQQQQQQPGSLQPQPQLAPGGGMAAAAQQLMPPHPQPTPVAQPALQPAAADPPEAVKPELDVLYSQPELRPQLLLQQGGQAQQELPEVQAQPLPQDERSLDLLLAQEFADLPDIFENLRTLSANIEGSSFGATDWIPEMTASAGLGRDANAAAAAAAAVAALGPTPALVGGGASGGYGQSHGQKRERSVSACHPTTTQRAGLQTLLGGNAALDVQMQGSFTGSFRQTPSMGRHYPAARVGGDESDVLQGVRVAQPLLVSPPPRIARSTSTSTEARLSSIQETHGLTAAALQALPPSLQAQPRPRATQQQQQGRPEAVASAGVSGGGGSEGGGGGDGSGDGDGGGDSGGAVAGGGDGDGNAAMGGDGEDGVDGGGGGERGLGRTNSGRLVSWLSNVFRLSMSSNVGDRSPG